MKKLIPKILAWMCCGFCNMALIAAIWAADKWSLAGKLGATGGILAVMAIVFAAMADK